ncbi:hypothetical protein ABIE41_001356 [Bosea sp. OAE506]|uniref:hypothetical protein n=1 Tax=Bosea sp. OAE506 TaxID=2663870 RepID=UPI00178A3575
MTTDLHSGRYLGSFRWLVSKRLLIFGEELASAVGFDTDLGRAGIELGLFASVLHRDDQPAFAAATERASYFGGKVDVVLRLVGREDVATVRVIASCVNARRGRPTEFLGSLHLLGEHAVPPLAEMADHLCAAARIVRGLDERPLQRLVDMALVELGGRMATLEQEKQRERAALAVVG